MLRRLLVAAVLAFACASPAGAAVIAPQGALTQPWQAWANDMQAPSYPGQVDLQEESGVFECGSQPAAGCTAAPAGAVPTIEIDVADLEGGMEIERHELGHVFDAYELDDADRGQLMSLFDLPADPTQWWLTRTYVDQWGGSWTYNAGEWFAEAYRLCADWGAHMPAHLDALPRGANGLPPKGSRPLAETGYGYPGIQRVAMQRAVCQTIDAVGARHGLPVPAQRTYPPDYAHMMVTARVEHAKVPSARAVRQRRWTFTLRSR